MKFYVVRHCSTEYSEKKIYCGSTDAPLSGKGRAEAAELARSMTAYGIGMAVSSPSLRAMDTAKAIMGDRPILCDDRLRERAFGTFERTDTRREDGRIFRCNFAERYPEGESYLQVAARIYALLDELAASGRDNILLVTHGSVCRVIRTYFLPMTDEEFYRYSQPNGTVETYELCENSPARGQTD